MDSEPNVSEGIGSIADDERATPEAALITSDFQALVRKQLECLRIPTKADSDSDRKRTVIPIDCGQ